MGKGGNPFKQIGRGIEGIGKTAKNLVGGLTGGAIGKIHKKIYLDNKEKKLIDKLEKQQKGKD